MEKTLYNCYSDKCAAYCKRHHCGLTVKQIKGKECLKKNCWHFEKNDGHEYWRQKECIKAKRKARKERINQTLGGK